jgi:hypothetical protein
VKRDNAEEVLNYFLFEDVYNNRMGPYEDDYQITFVGEHFAVRHVDTGSIHTFKVTFEPSDLPVHRWIDEFEGQEWLFLERENDED